MTPTKPEASAPVVTRQDREKACIAYFEMSVCDGHPARGWLLSGTHGHGSPSQWRALDRIALAIATARHEERERCQRIVLNVYNVTPTMGYGTLNSILRVLRSGEPVEAGEHIAKEAGRD